MALSLGELFPLRGSRRAAALASQHAAQAASRSCVKAAARPSALVFETYEPRLLLSADVFAGYTTATYLANPLLGPGLTGGLADAVTYDSREGLAWRIGDRTRVETDLKDWIGKRAQAGRKVPRGFPSNTRFSK